MYSFLVKNLVLPVYDLYSGTSRFKFDQVLKRTQWFSKEQIQNLQNKNLRLLLRHAYDTVPYYHKVFKIRHLRPGDIKTVSDLVKLPSLTKGQIRKASSNLVSCTFPKRELIPYQSGGTGDPIRFFTTKESFSWEVAAEYRAYSWAGFSRGDRSFLFWGAPIDLAKSRAIIKRFTNALERITIADTYVVTNERLDKFIGLLRRSQPEIIRGYASSVYMVANRMVEKKITDVKPRAVLTAAETLFKPMRETIEAAFGCPVYDYYGSREVGAIAAQCDERFGYHISAENVALEFVDNNEPVSAGEKGVILVTNLRNFGMPFIRYKIGDIGVPSGEICKCGRGLPLMSKVEGRISDFVACYDQVQQCVVPIGPLYPVIISAVMHLPILNCQVVQEKINELIVRVVRGKGYSKKHTDFLVDYMKKHLGSSINIDVEFVDFISPLPSGKRSVFRSKIDPFELSAKARSD